LLTSQFRNKQNSNYMKKLIQTAGLLLMLLAIAGACSKESYEPNTNPNNGNSGNGSTDPTPAETISEEIKKADEFAQNALDTYYLWNTTIADDIKNKLAPSVCKDPITTVTEIRYKEDRWTQLFDDISVMQESVEGISTTHGMNLSVGRFTNTETFFFIVNLVYANSPAEKAGVKRGDIIISYNGGDINQSNLEDAYYGTKTASYGLGKWTDEGIEDMNQSVSLTPVKLYLDPVIISKTFDVNGKKVGYLMYDSFDLDSAEKLIQVCKQFKAEGVKELVLDLRYNGGGYVFTEELLASMLAPEANVSAGDLYQKEEFNSILTNAWSKDDPDFNKTYFSFTHEFGSSSDKDYKKLSTQGANIGLNKIYAIVSSNTASASESLLVGLNPFMDIETIGKQTHGKFCTGYILGVNNVYEKVPSVISKWGIYVMVGTYSDKDGKNMARPNGITPGTAAEDTPWEGYDLGDENESMLKAALKAAGKTYAETRSLETRPRLDLLPMHNKYKFGKRIMNRPFESFR